MNKNIFEEMKKLQNDLFDNFYPWPLVWPRFVLESPGIKEWAEFRVPAEDIKETGRELIAKFDLPGVDKKDINLHLTEENIEVKAEKKQETKEEKKGFFRQERSYRGFYRKSTLPSLIRPDQAKAEYHNGVLIIKMPKKEIGHKKIRKIEVKIK